MTNIKRSIAFLLATLILSIMLASEVHGNTQDYEEPPWIKSYVDSLFAEQALDRLKGEIWDHIDSTLFCSSKSQFHSHYYNNTRSGSHEPHLGSNRESGTEGSSQGPSIYVMPHNGALAFTVDDGLAWSDSLMDYGMTKIAKFLKEVARYAEEGLEDSEDRKKE